MGEWEMKKEIRLWMLLLGMVIFVIPSHVGAFNSATHLYIAEHVFQEVSGPLAPPASQFKPDLYYGSIGPDIDFFVRRPEKWLTAFDDTHHQFVDLRPLASSPAQMAFANGWLTHNEEDPWGADHYAHIDPGYIINKAEGLSGIPSEFAHLAIEVAIDVLLKDEDPLLGEKLLNALQRHSWKDRTLLTDVFVKNQERTDRLTLIIAELNFRQIMVQYARALSKPAPEDKEALAQWGAMLAQKLYGVRISSDFLKGILEDAIDLVKDDYKQTIDAVIEGIKNNLQ